MKKHNSKKHANSNRNWKRFTYVKNTRKQKTKKKLINLSKKCQITLVKGFNHIA